MAYSPGQHRSCHLVQRRTALINEIHGFLLERGITFPTQPTHLRKNLPSVVEDAEQNLSPGLRWLLGSALAGVEADRYRHPDHNGRD